MSQTYTEEQQRQYLDFIFGRLWSDAKGLIRDRSVAEVARLTPDIIRPVKLVTADLEKAPGLFMTGGDIILRAPAVGTHRLKMSFNLGITANVDFAFSLKLKPNSVADPNHTINVTIKLPDNWDLIVVGLGVASFGVAGLVAAELPGFVEWVIEAVLEGLLGGQISSSLTMLSSLTYDHQAVFEPNEVTLTAVDTTGAPEIGTNVNEGPLDWIDIVLVPDRYEPTDEDQGIFELQTDNIARVLLTFANRLDNERLREMGSVIRLWKLPIWGTEGTERITHTTTSQSTRICCLRNLA